MSSQLKAAMFAKSNLSDLLEQPSKTFVGQMPNELRELVTEYQQAYRELHGHRISLDKVVLLMLAGSAPALVKMSQQMRREAEAPEVVIPIK